MTWRGSPTNRTQHAGMVHLVAFLKNKINDNESLAQHGHCITITTFRMKNK